MANRTTVQQQLSIFVNPTTAFLVLSYTISVVAVLLNSIEITLILRNVKKATDFEIVLLNLSIADLINSVIFILVTALVHSSNKIEKVRFAGTFYWVSTTMAFSLTVSATFVAVIGIERFFAIKLPLQHRLWHTKRRRLVKYMLCTWLFDVIVVATFAIVDYLRQRNNPSTRSNTVSYFLAGLMTFGCALVVVLYTWVLHLMLLRSLKLFQFDKIEFQICKKRIKEAMKKEKSSIIICILVVCSFLTCNLPLIVDLFQLQFTMTSAILLKVSAVDNPLIYFFKGYLEKYYAKKRLVSLANETDNQKETKISTQGSNDKFHNGHRSDHKDYQEQSLAKEDIMISVVENFAVTKVNNSIDKH